MTPSKKNQQITPKKQTNYTKKTVPEVSYVNPRDFKPDVMFSLYGAESEVFDILLPQLRKPPEQTI